MDDLYSKLPPAERAASEIAAKYTGAVLGVDDPSVREIAEIVSRAYSEPPAWQYVRHASPYVDGLYLTAVWHGPGRYLEVVAWSRLRGWAASGRTTVYAWVPVVLPGLPPPERPKADAR